LQAWGRRFDPVWLHQAFFAWSAAGRRRSRSLLVVPRALRLKPCAWSLAIWGSARPCTEIRFAAIFDPARRVVWHREEEIDPQLIAVMSCGRHHILNGALDRTPRGSISKQAGLSVSARFDRLSNASLKGER
jgi:hypothetical protein